MPGFLNPGKGLPLLLIPEYSGISKGHRVPDRSKTAHRKPLVQCFLTVLLAAALSLQLCPTLCDPVDHHPPGSSVHGIL